MPVIGLFVTGTDTEVGKTTVSVAILNAMTQRGWKCAAMKPAESGCPQKQGKLVPMDANLLRVAGGSWQPVEEICIYSYEDPVAPGVAAYHQGEDISFSRISRKLASVVTREQPDLLVIEGAGGILVPLTPNKTIADLAEHLGFPILIVAHGHLGTINHTLLTVEVLRKRGLSMIGVILNCTKPTPRALLESNAHQIEAHGKIAVLGTLDNVQTENPQLEAQETLDIESIVALCST